MNPSVVAQIARLGAAELEKRAEQPQKWRPPEKPLTDDEMDLVIANVNAWPGVVRRPEDGYALRRHGNSLAVADRAHCHDSPSCLTSTLADCHALSEPRPSPITVSSEMNRTNSSDLTTDFRHSESKPALRRLC
jgi:hypothetical protein